MVFHTIAVWLLVASVPLWGYRWYVFFGLEPRERAIFRRIVTKHYESAFRFGARVFGYLVALAIAVMLFVYTLGYLKKGQIQIGAYKETIRSRLYSGLEPVDQALNTLHYEQPLPVAILITCLVLSVVFTLVAIALRDISLLSRLRRKLTRVHRGSGHEPA
jgi:multisubunit Na+/H+ antiporter MnhC subunit